LLYFLLRKENYKGDIIENMTPNPKETNKAKEGKGV
jgi:hypothetical protein